MTTAAPEKIVRERAEPVKVTYSGPISIDSIRENGNFRKHFDVTRLKELSENIRKVGVLEPILVRKEGAAFILIAGARRLRASKLAKLTTIKAEVLDVEEKEANEIQALENLHREDLNPIEEATAFKTLTEESGYTVEELARRIDKSTGYVYQAIRLLDLDKEAIRAIAEGTIRPTYGHQLLRCSKKVQVELTAQILKGRITTLANLRAEIEDEVGRDLAKAKFPKDAPYAGEPTCTACPHNSGNQGMLFDGAKAGQCTNAPCFDKKESLFVTEQTEKMAKEKGVKNLGVHEQDYNGLVKGVKGAIVLPEGVDKGIVKKHPEAFAVATMKDRYNNGKQETQIVCLDPKILPLNKRDDGNARWAEERRRENAKKKRDRLIEAEMYREIIEKLPPAPNAVMLRKMVNYMDKSYAPRSIWDAVGYVKNGSSEVDPKQYETATPALLGKIAFLLAMCGFTSGWSGTVSKEWALLGIKIADVKARAVKKVAAAAEAKKAKKPAAVKESGKKEKK